MKALFGVGVLLLVLGVASLFIPIPKRERTGLKVGDVSVGVTTEHNEKVAPAVSGALILAGAAMLAGARWRKA